VAFICLNNQRVPQHVLTFALPYWHEPFLVKPVTLKHVVAELPGPDHVLNSFTLRLGQ